jgi:phosphatidylethanolamine-binding protein (PEBP) family uncharacterized protein
MLDTMRFAGKYGRGTVFREFCVPIIIKPRIMTLQVSFGGRRIAEGRTYHKGTFSEKPAVNSKVYPGALYAMVMYDVDAPYQHPHDDNSPFLHWLVTNISSLSPASGDEPFPYVPPDPPADSPPHTYVVELFEQPQGRKISLSGDARVGRARFPLSDLVTHFGLVPVGRTWFRSAAR